MRRSTFTAAGLLALLPTSLLAHGVAAGDKGYIQEMSGVLLMPFAYLGAKHIDRKSVGRERVSVLV